MKSSWHKLLLFLGLFSLQHLQSMFKSLQELDMWGMNYTCNLTLPSSLIVSNFILNSCWSQMQLSASVALVLPEHLNQDSPTGSNKYVKSVNHIILSLPLPFFPFFYFSFWNAAGGEGCSGGTEYSEGKEIMTTSITAWSRSENAAATQPWKNLSCFSASVFWSKIETEQVIIYWTMMHFLIFNWL